MGPPDPPQRLMAVRWGTEPRPTAPWGPKGDIDQADSAGWTALMHAAARGHLPVLQTLLQARADVEASVSPASPSTPFPTPTSVGRPFCSNGRHPSPFPHFDDSLSVFGGLGPLKCVRAFNRDDVRRGAVRAPAAAADRPRRPPLSPTPSPQRRGTAAGHTLRRGTPLLRPASAGQDPLVDGNPMDPPLTRQAKSHCWSPDWFPTMLGAG